VLVVEDELLIRWSLGETLTAAGMTVLLAADAKSAIAGLAATPNKVDVVVLDYRLPDLDGFLLLDAIRLLAPSSQVILMTAFGTPEVLARARELGMWRVVDKPFELAEMSALVIEASMQRLAG
jgi:DNA-binding NtrC family response regulator